MSASNQIVGSLDDDRRRIAAETADAVLRNFAIMGITFNDEIEAANVIAAKVLEAMQRFDAARRIRAGVGP